MEKIHLNAIQKGKRKKSFSISEHFVFDKICREIINGEERDRAAVSLLLYGFITTSRGEKHTKRQYKFISLPENNVWIRERLKDEYLSCLVFVWESEELICWVEQQTYLWNRALTRCIGALQIKLAENKYVCLSRGVYLKRTYLFSFSYVQICTGTGNWKIGKI